MGSVAAFAVILVACGERARASDDNPATSAHIAQARSAARCDVQGVWSLDSVIVDGSVERRGGWEQMKIIAGTHYSWVGQEGGEMPLATPADSLAAYRTRGSGGGTYRVTDSTYIEQLDFFYDPQRFGRDRWDHSFDWPIVENGRPRTIRVQEIWRRVE